MRICAVSLPELRIELVRESDSSLVGMPLAVVVAPPPMTETKLLGNTRLAVVSREARKLGVLPGQTIAQARARAADLAVRVVRPDAVRDQLARLAEVGLAFGATVSFGMDGDVTGLDGGIGGRSRRPPMMGDVVWIDVTGCAHLHAPSPAIFDGETILASRLFGAISALGHTCSIAIADGPRVAAMLARSAAESSVRASTGLHRLRNALPLFEPTVVRPGENANAIATLPVASLPLAPEDVRWLAKVGVRTIEALRELPRDGLAVRLGARARDVSALIDGEDRAPLTPYIPPEIPEETLALEYGIEGTQALTFVAKTLTDRLASRLQGRAVAAGRIELELRLDAAMLRDVAIRTTLSSTVVVALDLPAALSAASDLLSALRPKIERLVLDAPVLGATLRAPVLVHKRAANLSLFEPQPKAERALPRLVAELVSDLGAEAISSLVLGDSWVPEERSRLVPFDMKALSSKPKPKRKRHMLSSVPEPTRLLPEPRVVPRDRAHILRHLSRVEAVEWWKEMPSSSPRRSAVDYVQAWTDEGAAWIEIDRTTGTMRVRGWFD